MAIQDQCNRCSNYTGSTCRLYNSYPSFNQTSCEGYNINTINLGKGNSARPSSLSRPVSTPRPTPSPQGGSNNNYGGGNYGGSNYGGNNYGGNNYGGNNYGGNNYGGNNYGGNNYGGNNYGGNNYGGNNYGGNNYGGNNYGGNNYGGNNYGGSNYGGSNYGGNAGSGRQGTFYQESFFDSLLSYCGRSRRSRFWLTNFFCVGIMFVFVFLGAFLTGGDQGGIAFAYLLGVIPCCGISFANGAKRLHDLGHNGWLQLLLFIPIINFGLVIYMAFFEGQRFDNQYGPSPY